MSCKDELLNKAIADAKEAEDWQLVEWLRTARGADAAARWCTEKLRNANRTIRKLQNENAKLLELLSDYQTCTNRSCPECRYYDECFDGNHATCCIAIDILDKRAQEFGIGVRDELGTQV